MILFNPISRIIRSDNDFFGRFNKMITLANLLIFRTLEFASILLVLSGKNSSMSIRYCHLLAWTTLSADRVDIFHV